MKSRGLSVAGSTADDRARDGTDAGIPEPTGAILTSLAGAAELDQASVDAALAPEMIARTATILWVCLLAAFPFTALDVIAGRGGSAAFYVKCLGIISIFATLQILRSAWAVRHARGVAIAVVTVAYLQVALSGAVSPSHEYETTAVLFVGAALTTAVLLPWGLWPQMATVLVGMASLGAVALHAEGNFHALPADPSAAVLLGFALSVVGAHEVQRYRLALMRELAARRRAEGEARALNVELEQRVADRTGQLQAANEQLRALSARLQSVREEERTRLAREIHDVLGQALTGLKLNLDQLPKRIGNVNKSDDRLLQQSLTDMSELTGALIQSVRGIATELRPAALDDLGLPAAIELHATEFEQRSGVRCRVRCDPDTALIDRARATALFRIAQEALANVARHASARSAGVTLRAEGDAVLLEVRDDGVGIADDALRNPHSLGLLGMRERARLLGGGVEVWGVPLRGTTVRVRLPRHESEPARATLRPPANGA
jgi:signal transduction histidine kinase